MSAHVKPIIELDANGNVIGRWPSLKQAGAATGLHHYLIAYYCKSKGTMKNGRIFRYDGDAKELPDFPDYPCITCRRFSRNGRMDSGYCLRHRRTTYIDATCGEHEYPKEGRFTR